MAPIGDNSSWSARFYPTVNIDWSYYTEQIDNNTITLKNNWTDQVGNPGTSVTTSNYVVDTYRPQATFTITIADNTTCAYSVCGTYADGSWKKALAPGDNGTLTVVFSDPNPEPIFNFNSDSDIDNTTYVTLSTMTSTDNITWTGTFTPVDNSTSVDSYNRPISQQQDTQSSSYNVRFLLRDGSFSDNESNPGDDVYSDYFIVDTKPPYVTEVKLHDGLNSLADNVLPTDNTESFNNRCIPIHSDIYVTFDYFMNTSSITTNAADTECRNETIQVSSDNFSTNDNCIKIANPAISNSNKTFKLDPVDNLTHNTTYTVRVTTGVQDALENNMTNQFNHTFSTSASPSTTPTSGVFTAVGLRGTNFRSIDNGTSWENGGCAFLDKDHHGVAYGNNTFVAVGESGKIARSTDNGSSWSSPSSGVSNHQFKGVTFGNNIFEVSGSTYSSCWNCYNRYVKILKSTDDGSSWSSQNSPHLNTIDLYGLTFGSNTFVGVGENGKIVRSTNDGSSWDNVTSGNSPYPNWNSAGRYLYGVAFGNSTFVAVGVSGKIIRSTNNGASWSNSTSGTSSTLYGVTFGNNTFVAVGSGGIILTSPDGITWTTRTSGTSNNLYGVTFGN